MESRDHYSVKAHQELDASVGVTPGFASNLDTENYVGMLKTFKMYSRMCSQRANMTVHVIFWLIQFFVARHQHVLPNHGMRYAFSLQQTIQHSVFYTLTQNKIDSQIIFIRSFYSLQLPNCNVRTNHRMPHFKDTEFSSLS